MNTFPKQLIRRKLAGFQGEQLTVTQSSCLSQMEPMFFMAEMKSEELSLPTI